MPRPAQPIRPAVVLAVLLTAPFLAQADATIANVATPAIRAQLGASGEETELVVGGYLIAFALLLITGARLGQTHGYRRLFIAGLSVFALASALGGAAPDASVLVGMRALQGAGAALMFPQALTGIQLAFTGARRARAIGLYAIALASGAVLGQVLGGVLIALDVAGAGWRPILLINVPVCLAIVAVARRHLPTDAPARGGGLDVGGVLALSLTVLLVVVPLTLGRGLGWPAWTVACLVLSVPALAGFVALERRVAAARGRPLVDVRVVGRPPVLLAMIALLLATGTYYALLFTLAQYVQTGLDRSALASGLMLVPWVAAFGLAGQLVRRLPDRVRPTVPAAGYALLTLAYLGLGGVLSLGQPGDATLALLLAAGGLGLGTGFAALLAHLTAAVPAERAPDVSGVSTTMLQVGGALGVAAFGTLYLALATPQTGDARHAFATTTLALAAVAGAATLAAHLSTARRFPRLSRQA